MSFQLSPYLLFPIAICCNQIGLMFLKKSEGFTHLNYTAVTCVFAVLTWLTFSRLLVSGIPVSIMVTMFSAGVPLATILTSTFILGESMSLPRLCCLLVACAFVAVAYKV